MSSNSYERLKVLLYLIVPTLLINWQGSGNMSESNMTEINNNIKNNPITATNTAP